MATRIRNRFKGAASIAAAGLLTVLASASANAAGLQTAAWLGQIEVTAPITRRVAPHAKAAVANLGAMTVTASRETTDAVANLGSMTVTATSQARVAGYGKPVDSAGESEGRRSRIPRAVLVQ